MLIRRFIAPYYKGYLSLAVLFNILSALLNLVAFALVMPILNILFQIEERVTTYIPFSSLDLTTQAGWSQMKEVVTNNFGYFVSQLIETEGASYTLIILGIYLVLMTLLKVGATYLGGFFLVPIRTGVVRDLRNQLNAKILALPLGFFSEDSNSDFNSSLTKSLYSTPRDARKGISNSNNDTWDALVKNKVSARRGLPMMRAGLKRHVKRGLWEEVALPYRENSHHLSVGLTTTMVIPFSDDAP